MPAEDYDDGERRTGQRVMVAEGVFSRAMDSLTGGVVLAAFALFLGASDVEIGLIAAIPFLAQLAHLPAIALLARFPDRRPLAVYAAGGARLLFVPVALLPFVALPFSPVFALVALLVAYATLATLSGAAWQLWMRDLVPREELGRYHGRRFALLAGVGFVSVLAAGQFLAWWRDAGPGGRPVGFAALFVAGAALGVVSAAIMLRAPSRPSPAILVGGFRSALRRPFGDRNYRRVLVFLGAWGFAANLALPFITVVLLRTLGYGLGVVTALAALSMAANYAAFRVWAPLTDRFGAKPVLGLSASLFVLTMLAWAGLPKIPSNAVLAAAGGVHVLLGIATAGLDLASTTIVMKLAPRDEAAVYLSSTSVVKAVAAGVAPLLGGVFAMLLAGRSFTVSLGWAGPDAAGTLTALRFAHYDFLFLASAALGLYAVHRLLGFEEPGEASADEVVRAMRRDMGSISSVAGMRQFAHLASYVVEAAHRAERAVRRRRADEPGDRRGRDNTPPHRR